MHHLLEFYKDLIVFTAGTAIIICYILGLVELYDRFFGDEEDES